MKLLLPCNVGDNVFMYFKKMDICLKNQTVIKIVSFFSRSSRKCPDDTNDL